MTPEQYQQFVANKNEIDALVRQYIEVAKNFDTIPADADFVGEPIEYNKNTVIAHYVIYYRESIDKNSVSINVEELLVDEKVWAAHFESHRQRKKAIEQLHKQQEEKQARILKQKHINDAIELLKQEGLYHES